MCLKFRRVDNTKTKSRCLQLADGLFYFCFASLPW